MDCLLLQERFSVFARASRAAGLGAGRAGPPEFKAVAHDCVAAFFRKIVLKRFNRAHIDIIDPAAGYTANVIMQLRRAVKSFLAAADLDFLNNTPVGKAIPDCDKRLQDSPGGGGCAPAQTAHQP